MRNWKFEHDNGRNPQTETARFYVESWETIQAENIGYLFWGGVGTGKSYLAACIANALMAVSYTHLDVYKRQVNFCSSILLIASHGNALYFLVSPMRKLYPINSFSRKDVYKRQMAQPSSPP